MRKQLLWVVVCVLMLLSLVAVSCSNNSTPTTSTTTPPTTTTPTTPTTTTPTTPTTATTPTSPTTATPQPTQEQPVSSEKPQYGGTLVLPWTTDPTYWDPQDSILQQPSLDLTMQRLWDGDWTKGNAGGYGEGLTDWRTSEDVRADKMGFIASDIKFAVDSASGNGTIVYTIRQGVHWALNPNSPGAKIANGREVTADDVVFSLVRAATRTDSMINRANPALRTAQIEKTGPWEVTVTVPADRLLEAGKRFGDSTYPVPMDVVQQLGDLRDWHNAVGTGPYIIQDYVADGSITLTKNPDYWLKNPIGPGKGDQLPYIDTVRWLIIPDTSTRLAAVRTGKIDMAFDVSFADAQQLASTSPKELLQVPQDYASVEPAYMVVNNPDSPMYDVNVRRAMMMSIDFQNIEDSLYNDTGNIQDWPYDKVKAYSKLYLDLNAPDCPPEVKELYSYNPTKAKQMLTNAGYPNGFKTTLDINTGFPDEADYYSIVKGYFAAIGIQLTLNPIENTQHLAIRNNRQQKTMITSATGPPSIWPMLIVLTGQSWQNASLIDDPKINQAAADIGFKAITDPDGAMADTRELMKYVLAQAYVIPAPSYPRSIFYWPWIKNYSGERSMGYFWVMSWPQYVWLDQNMKKTMGY